jgi:hypothetical protein
VFEEPVTESIAPGYFDVVSKPMDYSTIEKKIEINNYKSKEEVSGSCTCSLGVRLKSASCDRLPPSVNTSCSKYLWLTQHTHIRLHVLIEAYPHLNK